MLDHVFGDDAVRVADRALSVAVPHRRTPDLSVVVPTRNEAGNVGPLLDRIAASAGRRVLEVLFVDDSDDDTPAAVLAYGETADPSETRLSVRLVHRAAGDRSGGLGGAVVAGLREARGDWVVVMDGDLQHPPELALQLADVGRSWDLDLVVATRRIAGGSAGGLDGIGRHAASRGATALAKSVFPRRLAKVSDPMSGLFAIRRAAIDADTLLPTGFKILMEIKVRYPRLRMAEVPFSMASRHAGETKASWREGLRFVRHLARLRLAGPAARGEGPTAGPGRLVRFGVVGLSGLLVNTAVLFLALQVPHLHYLVGAVLATEASTAWLFLLTERFVYRDRKPRSTASRAARFFMLNHVAMLARLPLLAVLVELVGIAVLLANIATLGLMFLVRFLIADSAIYREPSAPLPAPEPMRLVIDVGSKGASPPAVAGTHVNGARVSLAPPSASTSAPPPRPCPGRYLAYRYSIPGVATIGSQVRLRELEYFRDQHLGDDTEIQVRVGPTGTVLPRLRASMSRGAVPPSIGYSEHLGRWGANFHVALGEPIAVTAAPALAASPHVLYTNVLEALLRFVAVSKGAMLLHSACLELGGVGMLISAETDTGKTGTVLRMVREHAARFLSDDMTVLHADGVVGCFPKPLTITQHTLRAIANDELTPAEWRRLRLQSALHSREGRQIALLLSRLNIPIMGVNALTQRLVPPPKYAIDRLLPCQIIQETAVSELFVISRGEFGSGELARSHAIRALLDNTEDAYQFPPFRQFAPSVVIGADDHAELRRKERAILASAIERLRCRWIATPDFSWADEISRTLVADGAPARANDLSPT